MLTIKNHFKNNKLPQVLSEKHYLCIFSSSLPIFYDFATYLRKIQKFIIMRHRNFLLKVYFLILLANLLHINTYLKRKSNLTQHYCLNPPFKKGDRDHIWMLRYSRRCLHNSPPNLVLNSDKSL